MRSQVCLVSHPAEPASMWDAFKGSLSELKVRFTPDTNRNSNHRGGRGGGGGVSEHEALLPWASVDVAEADASALNVITGWVAVTRTLCLGIYSGP